MAIDWSRIGKDLVLLIAEEALKNGVCDVVSMAAVCRWWRKCLRGEKGWTRRTLMGVSPVPYQFPRLMLPEKLPNAVGNPIDDRDYIHLAEGISFLLHLPELRGSRCCGSGYGWLVMAREVDFLIRLVNPFTRQQIQLPGIPYCWSEGDFIIEFERDLEPDAFFMTNAMVIGDPSESREGYTVAAVIFSHLFLLINRRDAKIWSRVPVRETPTRMAYDRGSHTARDGVTAVENFPDPHLHGIMYCFADEDIHDVEAWCLRTGRYLWFGETWERPIPSNLWMRYKRRFRSYLLKVSDGNIYGASRPLHLDGKRVPEDGSLVVFRLNLRPRMWKKVTDLRNCCLFLGDNTSMALSPVPENSVFRRNHVYFTRSCMDPPETRKFDLCDYDVGNGRYHRYLFADAASYSLTPSLWVAFNPRRADWI